MIARNCQFHADGDAFDIGVWENEGGSPGTGSTNHHYGRRVESNGSWTIYHVSTGEPADIGGRSMIGLGEADATATMMSLNARNAKKRHTARWRQAFASQLPLARGSRS